MKKTTEKLGKLRINSMQTGCIDGLLYYCIAW